MVRAGNIEADKALSCSQLGKHEDVTKHKVLGFGAFKGEVGSKLGHKSGGLLLGCAVPVLVRATCWREGLPWMAG